MDGLEVAESWTEYGVVLDSDTDVILECDSLQEAQQFAATLGSRAVQCRVYLTEWETVHG
jgi:hypothetical protein